MTLNKDGKKLLIIAYEFPPCGGSGVQRVVKFAKYLPRFGWEAAILTAKDIPTAQRDEALIKDLPPGTQVEAAFSLEPTRFYRWLAKLKSKFKKGKSSGGGDGPRRGATNLPGWAIRLVQAFFYPDEKVGWLPWAAAAGVRIIRKNDIKVIFTTALPATSHLLGLRLSKKTGLPWIADFRDPWVGNEFKPPPTPLHRLLDRRFEAKVVKAAAVVISANAAMTAAFKKRYPKLGDKFITITNGFDPDDFPAAKNGAGSASADKFTIVYTGTFFGARNPDNFLQAARELAASDPGIVSKMEIKFVGPIERSIESAVAGSPLEEMVTFTGFVSHDESIKYLMDASALLLIVSKGVESRRHLAGKLFEYLGAKKPILALVGEGEAAKIIRAANAGIIVDPDNVSDIKKAIAHFYEAYKSGRRLTRINETVVNRYDRRTLTGELAEILDEITVKK